MSFNAPQSIHSAIEKGQRRLDYLHQRLGAELSFARFLIRRNEERRNDWTKILSDVHETATKAAESGSAETLARAVNDAEAALEPLAADAKAHTIYCAGHAHIDMNWQWSWPETVSVTIDSMTTVLDLLERYPLFRFSQSQASIYRILEKYRPDILERIAACVSDGRFEVTASHWVECEKNIVSGESLCRHLLYTRQYMRELFGLEPEDVPIDWSPDTFGHAETVPTYLRAGGVRYLYLHRPGAHGEQPVPRAFRWYGPDGSFVFVKNDMHLGYNGAIRPDIADRSLVPFVDETGLPYALFVYGVGDHGGGPTRRDLERIIDMQTWPIFPKIEFSTVRTFYERLESDSERLPERRGDWPLWPHTPGYRVPAGCKVPLPWAAAPCHQAFTWEFWPVSACCGCSPWP